MLNKQRGVRMKLNNKDRKYVSKKYEVKIEANRKSNTKSATKSRTKKNFLISVIMLCMLFFIVISFMLIKKGENLCRTITIKINIRKQIKKYT